MAVRKIPLKEQPYLSNDGSFIKRDEDAEEDPDVSSILSTIRHKVLTDRALHDKVES